MIDFTTVTREFRGLVDRRREVVTFLGSAFAAMGLFVMNALEGKVPPSLRAVQEHVFAFYALVLMVISLLLALRLARLHGGMVLNGVLYAALMQNQHFTRRPDPRRAARHNPAGVSFLQFVLVDLIAAYSTFLLVLAMDLPPAVAATAAGGVCVCWMALYFRFHAAATEFALGKAAEEPAGEVTQAEWREHVSLSLQQANHGLIGELAFAGLMVFSCFGAMSGLGKIEAARLDLGADLVKRHGPLLFAGLMVVTCLVELVIYLRVRIAIGDFSLQLDPTDRPFRPLRLTDSLLGYMLLAFLFCISVHVLTALVAPAVAESFLVMLGIDAATFAVAVAAEQTTLAVAARRRHA